MLDFNAPDFVHDPYPTYAAIRAQETLTPVGAGGYAVARHADVLHALNDPAFCNVPSRFSMLNVRNRDSHSAVDFAHRILPFRDGPEHAAARRDVAKAFVRCTSADPLDFLEAARTHVMHAALGRDVELVRDIATPYALDVVRRWFGFPGGDGEQLLRWTTQVFRLFAPISDRAEFAQLSDEIDAFRAYVFEHASAADAPFFSGLSGASVSDADLVDNAILLFADGIENVRFGAANVLMVLAEQGTRLEARCEDAISTLASVTEALRLQTPAQSITRIVTTNTTWQGQALSAGTPVFLLLASANRDTVVFPDADTFVPTRDMRGVMTFGVGAHACVGGRTAEAMIAALMMAIAERDVHVATTVHSAAFMSRFGHRWPRAVEIRI